MPTSDQMELLIFACGSLYFQKKKDFVGGGYWVATWLIFVQKFHMSN